MKDANGKELKHGQKVRRVIAGMAVGAGWEYTVVSRKWDETDTKESLVAESDFVKELIQHHTADEYEVIGE